MATKRKHVARLPVRNTPQQERSRETQELILRTTEDLLEQGHEFSAIKVADIAFACGVTTGAIYARFRNKEAIVDSLIQEIYIDGLCNDVLPTLAKENCEGLSIHEIIRNYLSALAKLYLEHPALGRHFSMRSRSEKNISHCRRELMAFNEEMSGRMRARVMERGENVGHPDPRYAIDLAEHATDYTLQQKIFMKMPVAPHSSVNSGSVDKLIDELTNVFTRYLQVGE